MKKIIAIAIAAVSWAACNNTETGTTTVTSVDSPTAATPGGSTTYTASEGDVTYKDNKVMVMKNGEWVEAGDEVKLDNGVVVYRNGRVKKEDREVELKEGEIVNRTGNFFDKTGRAIDNAWEATKEGAKDAGRAIEKAADKVGEKVKDAVDGDGKNKKDTSR